VNSFEYRSTETEQLEVEQRNTETVSQEPGPVSVSVSVPETAPAAPETKIEDVINDAPAPIETFEVESIPQISTELAYSCLLIPRFSDHYLTGDVTRDLEIWMREVCISYGWRLDAITIRPGYVQWGMTVPLTANPAQFMKILRRQTSQRIFEDYPRFARKNVSPDFWAPGFSVMPGNTPQSAEDVNSFILQIRRQQGIY
jgi:REP element-mobilizing transposase RayT